MDGTDATGLRGTPLPLSARLVGEDLAPSVVLPAVDPLSQTMRSFPIVEVGGGVLNHKNSANVEVSSVAGLELHLS